MDLKKRGSFIVISILLGIILLSTNVSALGLYGFNTTIHNLYNAFYGWIDFIIYFLIFSSLARLTFEKVFSKGEGDHSNPAIVPLYLGFGLLLSLGLTLWTTQVGLSFIDIGIPALIILLVALIALAISWFSKKGDKDEKGGLFSKLGGWGLIILLIIILLVLLYFYPQLWKWIPWGDELMSILIIGLIIAIIIWLLSKLLGLKSKEGKEGEGIIGNIPWKWILLLLGIILLLLLLYYGVGWLIGLISTIIGGGATILWYILLGLAGLAVLYLLFKYLLPLLKKIPFGRFGGISLGNGLNIGFRFDPDRGRTPKYIQGQDDEVRITALVSGGSGRYRYEWKSMNRIPLQGQYSETISFDVNQFRLSAHPGQSERCEIRVDITDLQDTKKKGKSEAIFFVTAGYRPVEANKAIKIIKPIKSKDTLETIWNTELEFKCNINDTNSITAVKWTYLPGDTVDQSDIERSLSTSNILGNAASFKKVFAPREGPGEYTVFCIGLDRTGKPIEGVYDLIFITTAKEGEEIYITYPVTSGKTKKLTKREEVNFGYEIEKTKPFKRRWSW